MNAGHGRPVRSHLDTAIIIVAMGCLGLTGSLSFYLKDEIHEKNWYATHATILPVAILDTYF